MLKNNSDKNDTLYLNSSINKQADGFKSFNDYLKDYDIQYPINQTIINKYSIIIKQAIERINSNQSLNQEDISKSLEDDQYYINLILSFINDNNYLDTYKTLLVDLHKPELIFINLINSLYNGQIIPFKIKLIEEINKDQNILQSEENKDYEQNNSIICKCLKRIIYYKFIDGEDDTKFINNIKFISIILMNIFYQEFLDKLFSLEKYKTIGNIFVETNNVLIQDYILLNKDKIKDDNIKKLLTFHKCSKE